MMILLPARSYDILLRKSVRGTPVYKTLERAGVAGNAIVPADPIAVVCDKLIAEDLLKIAIDHCAEAVPAIVEAIESASR